MTLVAHISLSFTGDCEAALRFYERVLGGTILSMFTYGGSPMAAEAPPGWEGKIMHSSLRIGGIVVMAADVPLDRYEQPKGFQIMLEMHDTIEAERVFNALAENGRIGMPLQETFWAARFGVLVDQFGIPWSINCEAPPAPTA